MSVYSQRAVRVYLLDDHDIVRRGLRDLLAAKRDITLVGESGSAQRAMESIPKLHPDVMVLDVHLQDGSGIDVCRTVRAEDPSIAGVLLTAAGDDDALLAAVVAGASGYVVKQSRSADLIDVVRGAAAGRSLVDSERVARVSAQVMQDVRALQPAAATGDLMVLEALLAGLTTPAIADHTGLPLPVVTESVARLITLVTEATGLVTEITTRPPD
jgi:two-component system, NarL family, response regulator DevR